MKKAFATFTVLLILTVGLATPVFAQQQGTQGNQGFFEFFTHFFSRIFNPGQQGENQNNPSGTTSALPSEEPTVTGDVMGGASRLQGLVTAGKITATQEQQILAEIAKVQSEIESWSTSTGINAGYVYAGLRGPGISAGIGGEEPSEQPIGGHNGPQLTPGQGHLPGGQGPFAPRTEQ